MLANSLKADFYCIPESHLTTGIPFSNRAPSGIIPTSFFPFNKETSEQTSKLNWEPPLTYRSKLNDAPESRTDLLQKFQVAFR